MNKKEILKHIGKGTGAALCFLTILTTGACLPTTVANATPTVTPEITQMAETTSTPTPTSKPIATPVPTENPTPTPMPELTFEQKKTLLGFNNKFGSSYMSAMVLIFSVSFETKNGDAINGRIFCGSEDSVRDSKKLYVFSIANGEYLFTLDFGQETCVETFNFSKYLGEYSPNLGNLKLKNSTLITDMATFYIKWGLDYKNNPMLNSLSNLAVKNPAAAMEVKISGEDLLKLIIESTPQEEIIPFWTYTPGAKIPEELKGLYNEVDYPPATLPAPIPQ